ncbi:MAGE-like protein 2 isoform X2 [Gallus gallus]|uniref:MAGE-like protein 2 isoform X2 n=1 Tax=Gallus gallus TaxID=9031 RepID=UPI001AE2EF84|nr:MAGE-like protein 2 isoform X2 [Gallus gallus]XP_040537081.1 MAGE-like protein 2 isoform X2 [Gallus gallus]XP_040537085.1 MAGE-like protein 2 isoform X2 [Gallus gallus]XP_040537255.1 MAGE-like protein 2 isoform X2 [Gallus gallus]XP_040563132.1 MAGE-like protein 2 isoform X2 [Gallus gallus]XP_040563213.1 MAGE-like protein 2 isoform X2 [Gallus gallus]
MQPTIRGPRPVPPQPLPVPTATYLVPQASVWPGVPGIQGQVVQLPPGGLLLPRAQLLPVVQLPPGGLHQAVAPPCVPVHRWAHPLVAGTPLPQQPMGLGPGAVFHAQPRQPAGTCLLQAPGRPGPPPVLFQVPPRHGQVYPMPCNLPGSWELPMEPFADVVELTEDQGNPTPTTTCLHIDTSPPTRSATTLEPGVMTSSDVPDDVTDIQGLLSWANDVASAAEVSHENPSSPGSPPFIAELPDNPRESKELSTEPQAATGIPTDPFWGLPPSPGLLPEMQRGLSLLPPVVPPASRQLSPRLTPLVATTPPPPRTAQPIEEVQQRQPPVVQIRSPLSPGSVPCRVADKKHRDSTKQAKRPAPAGIPKKQDTSRQEQSISSAPAKKGKLPPRKERKGRKHPHQVKPAGARTGASSSSGQAGTASELRRHLLESIQAVHPLGQRVTAVGPVHQPPSVQPQPTASAVPAGPQPQRGSTDKAVPAPPGTTVQVEDTAKKTAPSCLRPSPRRSSPLRRDPPSQQHRQQPRPRRSVDFVPCVGPRAGGRAAHTALEESLPITPEQRPERERMKKLAQEERERAAHQMKIGPVQFLVQRAIDMAIADKYGYP